MPLYPVTAPVKQWYDRDGNPLEGGKIYFGTANQNPETNPITMYWDVAGTTEAPQPLRTIKGYIVRPGPGGAPANVYAVGDFSITVRDANDVLLFTQPVSPDLQLGQAFTGSAAAVAITDAGGHYTTDNVEAALQQIGNAGFVTLARLATEVTKKLMPTGAILMYGSSLVLPDGWVWGNGKTIGSAASSATGRANVDTSDLYTLLWNSYGNTELPIQDSAGVPTTRGASAAADFAANKRLPVPDYRCRVPAGLDNMNSAGTLGLLSAASGVVATTMGEVGGTETHVLGTAEIPSHTHTQDAHTHTQAAHNHTQDAHNHTQDAHNHTQNAHLHSIVDPGHFHTTTVPTGTNPVTLSGGGATFTSTTGVASDTKGTSITIDNATATNQVATATNQVATATNQAATATNNNATATNQNTGGGGAHQNTQPTIVNAVIIKL